jgi:hypothetical protein
MELEQFKSKLKEFIKHERINRTLENCDFKKLSYKQNKIHEKILNEIKICSQFSPSLLTLDLSHLSNEEKETHLINVAIYQKSIARLNQIILNNLIHQNKINSPTKTNVLFVCHSHNYNNTKNQSSENELTILPFLIKIKKLAIPLDLNNYISGFIKRYIGLSVDSFEKGFEKITLYLNSFNCEPEIRHKLLLDYLDESKSFLKRKQEFNGNVINVLKLVENKIESEKVKLENFFLEQKIELRSTLNKKVKI